MNTNPNDDDVPLAEQATALGVSVEAFEAGEWIIRLSGQMGSFNAIDDKTIDTMAMLERVGGLESLVDRAIEQRVLNALLDTLTLKQLLALRDSPKAMSDTKYHMARVCADVIKCRNEPPLPENVVALGLERVERSR